MITWFKWVLNFKLVRKLVKFPPNWVIITPLGYKFGLKMKFIRVWPWIISWNEIYFKVHTSFWAAWSLNQSHSIHVRLFIESSTNWGKGIIKDYDVIKYENNCSVFQIGFLYQNFSLISIAVDHMVQGVHTLKITKNWLNLAEIEVQLPIYECNWWHGSSECSNFKISRKLAKFRLIWGIIIIPLEYKFGLKMKFTRVWPWKFTWNRV